MQQITIQATATITPVEAAADGKPQKPKVSINAYNGGPIVVAGYKHPVIIELSGLTGIGKAIPLLRNHNPNQIVGHGEASLDGNALNVGGKISATNFYAQDVTDLAAEGFPWQASVGVQPTKVEDVKAGAKATANGIEITGPMHIARAGKLYEVSFVPNGADDTTSATISANKDTRMSKVDAILEAQDNEVENMVSYEKTIQAAIDRGLDSAKADELIEAAIADNIDPTQFELKVMRLSRAPSISTQRHSGSALSAEVVEAAICRSIGDRDALGQFKPEVLEASDKQFKYGLGLKELLQMQARANGEKDISSRDVKGLLKAAFAPIRASTGFSTFSLDGVLSNVANKMIKAGFDSVESTWRKVSAISPVNDFKTRTSYSLTGDFVFQEVPASGEITSATMGEVAYTNAAKTYARMFEATINRQTSTPATSRPPPPISSDSAPASESRANVRIPPAARRAPVPLLRSRSTPTSRPIPSATAIGSS